MKKNVGSQIIAAQLVSVTDGSNVTTGTTNVAVEIDGVAGTGGTATHIANGKWEYAPIQTDTNGDHLTFQFTNSSAVSVLLNVYTNFPQTVDNNTLLSTLDTNVDAVLLDTGTTIPGTITTLQGNVTDILADTNELQGDWVDTGRLDTILDSILVDTGTTIPGTITTMQGNVTDILADTNELQGDWVDAGRLDTILDNILTDTGTTIPGTITTMQDNVTDILADTNELQTDWVDTGRLDTLLDTAAAGGGASAAAVADAVWTEAIADHSGVSGSTAEALNAAGGAGDPWITAIPGSYTTGQAGYIVGNNLAAVSTISVAPNRTFRVRAGLSALLCDQVITLQPGEDVTLAVDFSDVLNPGTALATVSTPTETTGASPAPTLDAEALSQDRQKAHFNMTGITDDLSYTVEVSVTTSDGQTLIVDCGLEGEETPT